MELKEKVFLSPIFWLGICLIVCTLIFVSTWHGNARVGQSLTVTGSAKRLLVSDLGRLVLNISTYDQASELNCYNNSKITLKKTIDYLKSKGIEDSEITLSTLNLATSYKQEAVGTQILNVANGFVASQTITITSKKVQLISDISLDAPSLISQNIQVSILTTEFLVTNIQQVKIEAQADAAKNAYERAKKIAESAGSTLGPIRAGNMGVIQITPRYGTQVEDGGMYDLSSIEKEITAVVSASFEVK